LVKSPVNGEISKRENDYVEIKDDKGNKFKIDNITPTLNSGQSVGEGETLGSAKGKVVLSVSSGFFSTPPKIKDFLEYKPEVEKKEKENDNLRIKEKPPEEELWRVPLETYYAPWQMAVDVLKSGVTTTYDTLFGKKSKENNEGLDESLLEEIKRIKKLLK
jgi:hypothetical protein